MSSNPKIPHVAWRDGRPRFVPSTTLREMGFKGEDLKNAAGQWLTAGEALDWSRAFERKLEAARRKARLKAGEPREKVIPGVAPEAIRPAFPVSQLFEEWLHPRTNPGIADRAPKTQMDYRQKAYIFKTHAANIWDADAEALTKPICLAAYDDLRGKAGNTSAVGAMRILGIALQWAMDRGRLPSMLINPAHKLKMKTPDARIRFATREELKALVDMADASGLPEMGDMFTLAVWSGQRQADRLQLAERSRQRNRITLQQLKTRAIVSILEAPELRKRLQAARERRKTAGVVSSYVILNERNWEPMEGDFYRRRFEDIRRAASVKLPSVKTLRDQDFRDTSVTWLAMAGCTIPEICAITGHSFKTAHEIMKHYLALNPDLADSAMKKLITWFEKEEQEA